jgi:hypothetical protein
MVIACAEFFNLAFVMSRPGSLATRGWAMLIAGCAMLLSSYSAL